MVFAHLKRYFRQSPPPKIVKGRIVFQDSHRVRVPHPRLESCFAHDSFTFDDAFRAMRRCTSTCLLAETLTNSPLGAWRKKNKIVRSCNGLVCHFGKDFTLWNPSTRKYKKLPSVDFAEGIDGSTTSCGFGYVESSNDYKVFASLFIQVNGGAYHGMVKVYSLKKDCWRIVDDNYKLETEMESTGRYLGGMLYWLRTFTNKRNYRVSWEIISFDLEKEAFGITVEQPGVLQGLLYTPQLGVFNGYICVHSIFKITMSIDIWILKQHTWSKMAIFPDPHVCFLPRHLFGVCTDGVIFRKDEPESTLFYYLPHDMCRRSLRIVDLDIFDTVCVHVESLVSLGNSEEAGVCGGVVDLEMENWSLDDYDDDDDDQSNLELEKPELIG